MKTIDGLPLYEDHTIEMCEKDVLQKHSDAVSKFKEAFSNAMVWKK